MYFSLGWKGNDASRTTVAARQNAVVARNGELHRRQAAIAERVAERLPDHASADELGQESAEQTAVEAVALGDWLPGQQALTADVERAIAQIADLEHRVGSDEKSEQIVAACLPAIENSRIAGQQLRKGRVQTAMKAQAEAVATLEDVSSTLKNHTLAAHIGILTIGVILLWPAFAPKQIKFVPAPLVALVVASCGAAVISMPVL